MFNEKTVEYSSKQNSEIPVWKSPKYEESKRKALEIIKSGEYGLLESDFWILMNETKMGKMGYTGLIISHNGCLKINDKLPEELKFMPSSVKRTENGHNGSLVYEYCNDRQGIFEVGEVGSKNCRNDYPYAMAFKRCFDRVILKISKLAYAGIYSDSEAEEFKEPLFEKQEVTEWTFPNGRYKGLTMYRASQDNDFIQYINSLKEAGYFKGEIKSEYEALDKIINLSGEIREKTI